MPQEPNVLVTHRPSEAALARGEVESRLEEQLALHRFIASDVRGLLQLVVQADPKQLVLNLRRSCIEDPGRFIYTYCWIPVELWTPASLPSLRKAVRAIAQGIDREQSWKLQVTERHYHAYSADQLICSRADEVDRPRVDLEAPDIVVRVEIIGDREGLVLHRLDEVLEVNQVRRRPGLPPL